MKPGEQLNGHDQRGRAVRLERWLGERPAANSDTGAFQRRWLRAILDITRYLFCDAPPKHPDKKLGDFDQSFFVHE